MAITYRESSSNYTASDSSLSIPPPTGLSDNDIMLAIINANESSTTITPPSGWELVRSVTTPSITANMSVYWKRASSETGNYVFSVSATVRIVGAISAFYNVITTGNPIDVETGEAQSADATAVCSAIITTEDNTMLVYLAACDNTPSGTWTPPTGMTEAVDTASTATVTIAYESRATAGSTGTRAATCTETAGAKGAFLVALKEAHIAWENLTLFWRCEDATLGVGDTYQTDNVASFEGNASISTTSKKLGNYGLLLPQIYSNAYLGMTSNDYCLLYEGRFGCFLKQPNEIAEKGLSVFWPSSQEFHFHYYDRGLSFDWNMPPAGITLSASNVINYNTWHFVEVAWKQSTNLIKIYVDGIEVASNSDTMYSGSYISSGLYFGDCEGSAGPLWMDNIMLSKNPADNLYLISTYENTPRYELPVNRQWILNPTPAKHWDQVFDVYVLKDGVWVPDKVIKILDSGSWI